MDHFQLVSSYRPSGDQPEAIAKLSQGIELGLREQTLLGVTGSGKTFTMASIIEKVNRPTLVLAHNKTLAAQLCSEFRSFSPTMQWSTLSPSVPGPENGGYLVLFGSDLSIFCGENKTKWGG